MLGAARRWQLELQFYSIFNHGRDGPTNDNKDLAFRVIAVGIAMMARRECGRTTGGLRFGVSNPTLEADEDRYRAEIRSRSAQGRLGASVFPRVRHRLCRHIGTLHTGFDSPHLVSAKGARVVSAPARLISTLSMATNLGSGLDGFDSPYLGHTGSWDGKGGAMFRWFQDSGLEGRREDAGARAAH